jgi:DNA polymerase IV
LSAEAAENSARAIIAISQQNDRDLSTRRGRPPSFGPSPAGYGAAALEEARRSEINGALFRKLHELLTIEPVDIGEPSGREVPVTCRAASHSCRRRPATGRTALAMRADRPRKSDFCAGKWLAGVNDPPQSCGANDQFKQRVANETRIMVQWPRGHAPAPRSDRDRAEMDSEDRAPDASAEAAWSRKIIHIDMDAFYASVEQRDNPELRGKPVAVGGSRERGVVAAASYEARKFGVHSAMPSVTAKRKCPDLIFVKPRFDAYKAVSLQIREIFAEYTPIIEPLSLDEAYLDVTLNPKGIASATRIAEEIRSKVRAETALTASAGVSYNKFLAKLASDHRKPDGLFVITPEMGPKLVETLPIRKFHGVGPATAAKMKGFAIATGLDLRAQTLAFLQQHFGKAGPHYYWIARGIDERTVEANRLRKSVGAENTFPADLFTYEAARDALREIVDKVWRYCENAGIRGRTVTLKVKFANFQLITRSRTGQTQIGTRSELEELGNALLEPVFPLARGIRLLGISLSSLATAEAEKQRQLALSR